MASWLQKYRSWRDHRRGRRHRLQDIQAAEGLHLKTFGSGYGNWTFHDDGTLQGCTIFSAGLGEDASFDLEFAAHYGARVILIDPTPRAVAHHEAILERIGRGSERAYVDGGSQPASAYALENVSADQLPLEPFALWTEATTLRFFCRRTRTMFLIRL